MKNGVEYKVIRRSIKYPRLELVSGSLVVIAPHRARIKPIIRKHNRWINNKLKFIQDVGSDSKNHILTKRTEKEFKYLVYKLVKRATKFLNISSNKIFFKKMKTKWASCSKRGAITFNLLLKSLPEELIWYITYHEMTHLIIRKHNNKFWHVIKQEFREFELLEKKLFAYWFLINENKQKNI